MKTPKEIATIQVAHGGVPMWALLLLLVVMSVPGWYVGHNWTGKPAGRRELLADIAAKNKPVQDIITKGNNDAEVIEKAAIEAIGDQDHDLKDAERKLAEAAKPKPVVVRTEYVKEVQPDCPRVPAYCLAR